jgi:hypothetical protein
MSPGYGPPSGPAVSDQQGEPLLQFARRAGSIQRSLAGRNNSEVLHLIYETKPIVSGRYDIESQTIVPNFGSR